MIDSVQMPVIAPYDEDARTALNALRYVEKIRAQPKLGLPHYN
jgi:hypothetical protein